MLSLTVLFIPACDPVEQPSEDSLSQQNTEPDVDKMDLGIFYGSTSPTLYSIPTDQQNAVMALYFRYYQQGFCSSTLVSPRVILTAAHCIKQIDDYGNVNVLGPSDIEVHVGPNSASPIDTISPSQVHYNSSWNGTERNDVAVIILGSPYYGATPIPIKRGGVSSMNGHHAQSVGFGMTQNSTDYNPNTRRNWTDMPVSYVSYDRITLNGNGSTGVAPGDSGGPLLYEFNGTLYQAGVASTGAEGWVYESNYSSVETNENWIANYIDQYDNPECYNTCRSIDCGNYSGCSCGTCDRGYECQSNNCVPIQAGTGGACATLSPTRMECENNSDCGNNEACILYQGDVSECAEICGPEACSESDSSSYCLPVGLQGGGYIPLCIEASPRSCSNEGESCTSQDGSSGVCVQLFQGEPMACYAYCEPVETCPEGTACIEHYVPNCDDICATKECGDFRGCDCGDCPSGEECSYNKCYPECEPDCSGKQCGDDGCDGSCGDCGSGEYCGSNGRCKCLPQCDGKECGDNECGGTCGTCDFGETCTADFRCMPVGPCSGPCNPSATPDFCTDSTQLCNCDAASTNWTPVDCNVTCAGSDYVACAFDTNVDHDVCQCEEPQPTDGDVEDGDITDGDSQETCVGNCEPIEQPFCIDGQRVCQCTSFQWQADPCQAICMGQGKTSQGCGLLSPVSGAEGCICVGGGMTDGDIADGDYLDGDFLDGDFLDGDTNDDDDDDDDRHGASDGSSGCNQTGTPFGVMLLFALLMIRRRVVA